MPEELLTLQESLNYYNLRLVQSTDRINHWQELLKATVNEEISSTIKEEIAKEKIIGRAWQVLARDIINSINENFIIEVSK